MLKQFHHMNAYTYTCADGSELFYSYETRIAEWHEKENTLYVGGCYRISNTTIRQFSRWLRENGLPSYLDVKKAANKVSWNTGECAVIDGVNVTFLTGYPFKYQGHPYALA